ncbi:hypothetical protein [Parasitella parasitica]|uniref:NUA/TPR/MLP1-2-like domain-containing protein n=1 Tax=Parasitella parasitica TaxID=35722 RepID=A0A0B7N8K2_9FUNG|nr:hypothetical protein [Parasitella parasitica]
MASLEEDSERLKGALGVNNAEQRIVELETTLENSSKRYAALQIELEKERSDKQRIADAKAEAERNKAEAVEKVQELTDSERRLRERETSNLESLSHQRDALNKTQQELNTSRQAIIQKTIEMEKMSSLINTLTTDKRILKNDLENTESRIESLSSQIKHIEANYDDLNKNSKTKRERLLEKINGLQAEKNELADQADQLRNQLQHARNRVIEVELKLEELVQQNHQLDLTLGSTSKAYRELETIYNEYAVNTHEKVAAFETKIQILDCEKKDIIKQNKDLELQLLQERELRKANFGQMMGVTEPATNEKLPSNLLRLMQDYRDLQRRPEDIFQDYFDLREKYKITIQSNSNLNSTVETLSRKQHESDVKFERLYKELKATAHKNASMANELKKQQDVNKQTSDSQAQLQAKYNSLQQEKDDLSATLNDTTYQLQHLLAEIQKRNEPVPASLKDTASLLRDTLITPTIPHDQLVFNNIAQLQDINRGLTLEVRALNQQLQGAQEKITSAQLSRESDTHVYKTALEEAKRTTTELDGKVKDLQSKLQITTTECDNYKKIVSELGDGDATEKFQQIQNAQQRQREEMDITLEAYRQETSEEVNKLKEELSSCRASEREVRKNLSNLNAEKRNLMMKIEQLSSQYQRAEQDGKSLGRNNNLLNERIAQKDEELSNLNREIMEQRCRIDLLTEEKITLKARHDATAAAYKDIKENIDREKSEKSQMVSLLEALQARLDISSAATQTSNEQSLETIERLNRELQHARDTLVTTEKQLDYYKSIDQAEIQDKYKESVIEVRLLKSKIAEIEQKLSDATQERIIAQTKLAATEEQLKSALSNAEIASAVDSTASSTCEEHVRLLAVAEDRVRSLENDNNAYQATIVEKEKLLAANRVDHDQLIINTQTTIDKLLKDIEERNASVQVAQQEAENSIAEYNTLKEKFVASQAELTAEKASLEDKLKLLEVDVNAKQEEIDSLKQSVEAKTTALAEAEAKFEAESKIAEEQRQTINALRSDVSNLTFEISQYKATIANGSAREETLKSELEHESAERAASEESWKQAMATLNKQHEDLARSVADLIAKHAEWVGANDKQNGPERAGFMATTEEIVKQLREANTTLRIEKDAAELNYQNERNKLRRKENELESIQAQVATLRADISRLRKDNKALADLSNSNAVSDKMQYEAFKAQNQSLIMENTELREAKQKALNEQAKVEAEISPLQVKIGTLESELAQANAELVVLQKSQKEWTARSAKLLSKYNRIDPAEIESVKAELEAAKAQLETITAEKAAVDSTVTELQGQIESNKTEIASLTQKQFERSRLAMEFRRKFNAANAKLEEMTKKSESANSTTAPKADIQKLTQEKEALEAQLKKLEDDKAKLDEANQKAESDKTTAETALAQKQKELDKKIQEHDTLENKYHTLLKKARGIQKKNGEVIKELETLKSGANTAETEAKIAALEEEATSLRKQLSEQSVEANRYKAQLSMAQNKSIRLQKEIEALKAQKPTSTLSPAAPAFQAGGSPILSPRTPATAASSSAPSSPAPPSQTKSPVLTKNSLFKKAIASSVHTPELSSTPAPASVDTPILTPVTTPVPQEDEPVIAEEPTNDEALPTTPDVTTAAATAEEEATAMQVDAELGEEGELDNKQTNKNQDSVPVEIEVQVQEETPETTTTTASPPAAKTETEAIEEMVREDQEKNAESLDHFSDVEEEVAAPDATTANDNPAAAETTTSEPNPVEQQAATAVEAAADAAVEADATENNTAEADTTRDDLFEGNAADTTVAEDEDKSSKTSNEPAAEVGTKRERNDEDEDLSGLESPTKKPHP